MKNPKTELRSYLERLIHRYLNVKSLLKELKALLDWQTPSRIEAFNLGGHFFQLVTYSLSRTVFVELSMLLSEKEERSLVKWLKKAREHAASIGPTRQIMVSNLE